MAKRTGTARRLAVGLARACAENRCRDVVVLDLRALSPVTDFFVVATGTSARQMRAAARRAAEAARERFAEEPFGLEGLEGGQDADPARWVLLDYVDVVVHLFAADARAYYDLELLWGDAPRVNWQRGWKPRPADETPEPGAP